MATTSDFRTGLCIEFDGDIYMILEFLHVKMQQRSPIVRTKLKNIKTGRVISHTFNSGDRVDIARIERRKYQFLYKDESNYYFMNIENYEQVPISESMINAPSLMKEGQEVDILFHADTETPISCELPPFVELEVVYVEPGARGDTASGIVLKPAKVETGATINVPLFINVGEKIKVDTRTNSYSERVK